MCDQARKLFTNRWRIYSQCLTDGVNRRTASLCNLHGSICKRLSVNNLMGLFQILSIIFIAYKAKAVGYLWPYYWNRTENTAACWHQYKKKLIKHILRDMQFSKLSMVISWYSGLRDSEAWYVDFRSAHTARLSEMVTDGFCLNATLYLPNSWQFFST